MGARYRAFLSYSHADAAFARGLHRRLEAYRLPRRLVGRSTPLGPVPSRLAPIFRDREDLAAAEDLTVEVRNALAESERLIVVCSPTSANSTWVAREIATFAELHPKAPILLVVAEGEPPDVFPAAFRSQGHEPLAADLRAEGEGPRLGLLKLVAGACGADLDELVQRDAQRRLRGMSAIAAVSVSLAAAMAMLAAVALQARGEAERQRGEAEGLVEFMLTDLRGQLEGVGRLDLMTRVNRRALGYYADQDVERLPAASLVRRARLLHAMGEDDESRGDLATAIGHFREARRTTAALLAAKPEDPDRIFNHAQSEFWVAFTDWRQGRLPEAQAGFERYAALAGRLLAQDARNADWRMEAGYAESNVGMLLLRDRNQARAAEQRFRQALAHFEAALAARPGEADIQREIADGYGWLADSQRAQDRFDEARATRRLEAALIARLMAKDPRNSIYARDLLGNELGMAQIDLDAGAYREAETRLAAAHLRAVELARSDPEDEARAKRVVASRLFLAQAMLSNRGASEVVQSHLADCKGALVAVEPELLDLCAVLAANPSLPPDSAAVQYLDRHRVRLAATHQSPRWGLNLSSALKGLSSSRKEHNE